METEDTTNVEKGASSCSSWNRRVTKIAENGSSYVLASEFEIRRPFWSIWTYFGRVHLFIDQMS